MLTAWCQQPEAVRGFDLPRGRPARYDGPTGL